MASYLPPQPTLTGSADHYAVSPEDVERFHKDGFVHLRGVMTDQEMKEHVDEAYFKFLRGEVPVPGKDLCDMSGGPADRTPEQYTIYNVMLPRLYYPPLQGNLLERRCLSIARQLLGEDMHLDFDQILAKRADSPDSVMAWHQDQAYWPPLKSDATTANVWVAVSDVPVQAGCLAYVPGTHKEEALRTHRPVATSGREGSHAIMIDLDTTAEPPVQVPMQRGDVVVHRERVVHGSGCNVCPFWRCGYVLNFKREACIKEEREIGFTHSHNDELNWDKFLKD